jgi:hypothetical protein
MRERQRGTSPQTYAGAPGARASGPSRRVISERERAASARAASTIVCRGVERDHRAFG